MKIYIGGCSQIKNPVDIIGNTICQGDLLSWDYGDYKDEPKEWMLRPIFKVGSHPSGNGLCARGIAKPLYLHDFRFKYCKVFKRANN